MRWLIQIALSLGVSFYLAGCYNSPVSVETDTIHHSELGFSITLPDNLAQQGWTIKADDAPSTYAQSYRFWLMSPDQNRIPSLRVEVRRHEEPISEEEWIDRASFSELHRADWEILEEKINSVKWAQGVGKELTFLYVNSAYENIDFGYRAQLNYQNRSVDIDGAFGPGFDSDFTLDQAIEEYHQRLNDSISTYKRILETFVFDPK